MHPGTSPLSGDISFCWKNDELKWPEFSSYGRLFRHLLEVFVKSHGIFFVYSSAVVDETKHRFGQRLRDRQHP